MNEAERLTKIEEIQLELFELAVERKQMKLALLRLIAGQKKTCRKCREEMEAEQFYVDERYSDGLYPYCRECKSDMAKQWYQKHKAA